MNSIQEWRWRRWDVRADGKVFWCYGKSYKNNQNWVTWDQAIKNNNDKNNRAEKYKKTTKGREYMRKYEQSHKRKEYVKKYYKSKKYSDRIKRKRIHDPMFAMSRRLRCRIAIAVYKKGYSKNSKTREMLGCDWNYFMAHLEAKFVDGMTWNNRNLWHIDHIIPIASATSEEELIKLNHHTNLQPLWARDNMKKGSKLNYQ